MHGRSGPGTTALVSVAGLIAVAFFALAALPYLLSSSYNAAAYAGRRGWLLVHIVGGTIALLSGPIQLWLGIADRRIDLHRKLGIGYLAGVAIAASGAFWLAAHPSFGWVYGAGLGSMAIAQVVTTVLAFAAIKRSLIEQHKEWMIRSYVVTFSFVTYRLFGIAMGPFQLGTEAELNILLAWGSWALPLLVTEAFLQGRKLAAVRA
ncbi:MAG TPA: DUF2306 domain-containing protein [Vicinamibacterales bacterium]